MTLALGQTFFKQKNFQTIFPNYVTIFKAFEHFLFQKGNGFNEIYFVQLRYGRYSAYHFYELSVFLNYMQHSCGIIVEMKYTLR